ncbi:S10A4 protein, partial [Nyctiprogne leucopyga]|nr:S10A4 protein [Nyctiprogne leucopyga]
PMASPLEQALAEIISIFQKYSVKLGNKSKLSKTELREMVVKELPSYSKQTSETSLEQLMPHLDSDNEVDFQEYVTFLARLAMMCNDLLLQESPDNVLGRK